MAWRNIKVNWINTCDITNFENFYNDTSWHGWVVFPTGAVKGDEYYRSEDYMNFYPDHIIWGSGSSGLGVGCYQFGIALYYNGNILGATSFPTASRNNGKLRFYAIVDDETQKGWFGAIDGYDSVNSYQYGFQKVDNMAWSTMQGYIYQILTQSQILTYNWQSVPSISGKNGILSLVTLDSEAINDGEPVSGAAISVFDQNPASGNNVKDIVDGNTPLIPSAVDVTATFIISNPPVGELASRILAAKKGSIPESIEDADKTVSIPADATSVTMPDLDENSQYYFAIFVADAAGDEAVSDPKDIYTSGDEGYNFDYTGEIIEWTVPKTGIYQLETWGAQGGDATDGTLTARGGYGAYAKGEILLIKDETVYIDVGGKGDHTDVLWNDDLQIRHSMTYDFISCKASDDAYDWVFENTYTLVGSGANNGNGNVSIVFQKGIKRKNATKLYVEIACREAYHGWNNSAMQLADTKNSTGYLPTGYKRVNFVVGDSSGPTDNYTHTSPYGTFNKILAEIDISDVDANTTFYLAFWKCNEKTTITKCYFDDMVEIEKY